MSHLAINAHNEVVLATEVKDQFLRTGLLDTPFRCVFCDVAVAPRSYARADHETEAYFKVQDALHDPGCPYSSGGSWAGSNRHATRTIFDNELYLPSELIARRTASLGTVGGPGGPHGGIHVDVPARTKTYGHLLGASGHAATSLLARVVEAWIAARAVCFKEARKKGINDVGAQMKFVSSKLKRYSLSLFSLELDYNRAFHKFVSSWTGAAIHYGLAKVQRTPSGFMLIPMDIDSKTKAAFAGRVTVLSDVFLPNQMSTELVADLDDAATRERVIHWFGYGELGMKQGTANHLEIADSSLLYLRSL